MPKMEIYTETRLTESHWIPETSVPLRRWTVPDALREAAAMVPERLALVEGIADPKRRTWTYAQLLADVEKTASVLLDRFKPGERVAIWADNVAEFAIIEHACFMAGIIMVTVNPAYKKREYLYVMNQSKAAGIFVIDEYRGHKLLNTVNESRDELPDLREVHRIADFYDFMNSARGNATFPEIDPMDPLIILYTSGTTGFPKGATLHHYGRLNSDSIAMERAGLKMDAVWVNPMPMFHNASSGLCFSSILTHLGTNVVLKEWDPELFMMLVQEYKGTISLMVPPMIEGVINHPNREKYDLSSLKYLAAGSAFIEPNLVKRTDEALGCTISIVYGLTEQHAPMTVTHREDDIEDQCNTVGQPLSHCEMKIVDPVTWETLPCGVPGEICYRGYATMLGYWDNPKATNQMIERSGWMHTKDMGTMDDRGFVKITGRVGDMIIRGGENIYPREIEILLLDHPKIHEVGVFGIPDEIWGEQVAAAIQPVSMDDPPTIEELDKYCKDNLTGFKRPRFWSIVEGLPMTPTGKVQKYIIKENYKKGDLKLTSTL